MTHFLDWFDAAGKLWTQEMVPGCFRLAETGIDVVQPGLPAAGPGGRDVIELNYQGGGWTFTALTGVPGMVAMGTANRAEAPVRSNGAEGLTHLMELRAGGQWYRYRRVPAFPLCGGQPCGSVDLAALRGRILVVGRKSEEGAPADSPPEGEARLRLELDEEAGKISRELVELRPTPEGYTARMLNRRDKASLLNDESFAEARLVYGDRLQIHDYDFEFAGSRLRQTDRWATGNLSVRALRVAVDTPKGKKEILRGLDLDIWSGEFIGIIGGSGQGKSTFLNALCGINPATSGTVSLDGTPIGRGRDGGNSLALVPQDDIVHRDLIVEDALNLSARLRLKLSRPQIQSLVDGVIDRLQLQPHRHKRINDLSGGQRKRVSIATELLARPTVLFLDEPSSGLDPATELELMRLLSILSRTGLTVICTTHVLENANLFRRICFIHGGRSVFMGPSEDATRYFGSTLRDVYSEVQPDGLDSEERDAAFRGTMLAQDQIRRFPPPPPVTPPEETKPAKVGPLTSLRLLLLRQWKILAADKLNLAFLLAQAMVIGALVGWVSDEPGFRMFLAVIATMWFGCSNAAQQIIGELPIFRRERIAGLGLNSYILSKFSFLTVITSIQAVLLFVTLSIVGGLCHPLNIDHDTFVQKLRDERDSRLYRVMQGAHGPEGAPGAAGAAAVGRDSEGRVIDAASGGKVMTTDFDDAPGVGDNSGADAPSENAAGEDAAEDMATTRLNATWRESLLWVLAKYGSLEVNIFGSGTRSKMQMGIFGDGDTIPDKFDAGLPVWQVVGVCMGLRVGSLLLAGLVGVALGLAVSSLARSNTQAVMWVPLILIPQILFGGYVVTAPEMTAIVRRFSGFMPSYNAQQISDVSHLYGERAPKVTNNTKIPAFLSTERSLVAEGGSETIRAGQEVVTWDFGPNDREQSYDKTAPHNVAWQNLAVIADLAGKRKKSDNEDIPGPEDSVNKRSDVLYPRFALYADLAPALRSTAVLGAWITGCYVLIAFTLTKRQYGK